MAVPKKRIGEMLLEAGIIDETQLKAALGHQRQWGVRLGQALVDLKLATEADIVRALSLKFGFEVAKLDALEPYGHEQALKLFPREFATRNNVFPMWADTANVTVAMSDPTNLAVVDEIRFRTGRRVKVCIGGDHEIAESVKRCYPGEGAVEAIALDLDADPGVGGEAVFDPFGGGSKDALEAFFGGAAEGEAAPEEAPPAPVTSAPGPAAAAATASAATASAAPRPARTATSLPAQPAPAAAPAAASAPRPGPAPAPQRAPAAAPARPAQPAAPAQRPQAGPAPAPTASAAATPVPPRPGATPQVAPAGAPRRPPAPAPALTPAPPAAGPAPQARAATATMPKAQVPAPPARPPAPISSSLGELELEEKTGEHGEAEAEELTPLEETTGEALLARAPADPAPSPAPAAPAPAPIAAPAAAPSPGAQGRELTPREAAIIESLDRLANGAPAQPDIVKPTQAMAALIRLLIKKGVVSELEFLDELSKK